MARWQRGEVGKSIKVTFQVKKSDHPELFEWLLAIPYGEASERIRDILGQALKRATERAAATMASAVAPATDAAGPRSPQRQPTTKPSAPVAPGALSSVAITEEVANMLLEMEQNF